MKWLGRIAALLGALLFVVFAATSLWLRTSLPQTGGTTSTAGIGAPVEIVRDRHGIPHITAKSDADAWFALGYVHAQDRLWQMIMTRKLGAGLLSELVGPRTVDIDRFMRGLDLYGLARRSVQRLPPEVRGALTAYASGVNAYMDSHPGALPPEFYALLYRPSRWTPADSLVWGRLMALRLGRNWQTEALRYALARRLDKAQIEALWPTDVTIPANERSALPVSRHAGLIDALLPRGISPITASNGWAVDGSHTTTGKPILANDPHLPFSMPGTWYLARITSPGMDLAGATVPGLPFLMLGHNRRIAWGFTTAEGDTQDLFIERIDPTDPNRYLTPDGPRAFDTRTETIRVRGGTDVTFTVRTTRHGPVVSDISPQLAGLAPEGHVLALASPALAEDDATPEAIYRLNRAGDWGAFVDALSRFDAPQQNIFYADVDGHIGMLTAGRVPIRRKGNGFAPVPGWTGEYDWTGYIPFAAEPHVVDPPKGRVVNANNRPVDQSYPYYLGRDWTPPYRADRIETMLDDDPKISLADTVAMQRDSLSLMAAELAPLMIARLEPSSDRMRRAVALLRTWDGTMDKAKPAPLIFTAWLRHFGPMVYDDELGPAAAHYGGSHPVFLRNVLTRTPGWCDDVSTPAKETCPALLARALDATLAELTESQGDDMAAWRWGKAHRLRIDHPVFRYVPGLAALTGISVPVDGGSYTVNRGAIWGTGRTPYASRHGAGIRAVYDLADLDRSLFVLATGQSGNPLSPYYGDMNALWLAGRSVTIPRTLDPQRTDPSRRLRLEPLPIDKNGPR